MFSGTPVGKHWIYQIQLTGKLDESTTTQNEKKTIQSKVQKFSTTMFTSSS
jgi:hypothetical protein